MKLQGGEVTWSGENYNNELKISVMEKVKFEHWHTNVVSVAISKLMRPGQGMLLK
jgi:hypothetical protein